MALGVASCWRTEIGGVTNLSPVIALLILEPVGTFEIHVERPEEGDTAQTDASERIFLAFEASFGPRFAKDDIID